MDLSNVLDEFFHVHCPHLAALKPSKCDWINDPFVRNMIPLEPRDHQSARWETSSCYASYEMCGTSNVAGDFASAALKLLAPALCESQPIASVAPPPFSLALLH